MVFLSSLLFILPHTFLLLVFLFAIIGGNDLELLVRGAGDVMVEQLLRELAEDLGFSSLPPKDKQGCFQLPLNPELTISIKELDPGVYFESPLGLLPKEKREELLIHLMKANFLGQGTGGGVISLDSEEKNLTLSFSLSHDVNYREFKETVEEFANFVDYWREELERHKKAASAETFL